MADDERGGLVRGLNLSQAASVVVGVVIGSGIFVGANRVAQGVDSVWLLFGVWIGAGLLTLLGALTYAEFGALFPKSGGDYVYARESLGPFWGFFNGWVAFSINLPASLGALALAWAGQLENLKPDLHKVLLVDGFSAKFTAVAIIAFFAIVNYFGVRQGGWAQVVVTGGKVVLILGLIALGLTAADPDFGRLAADAGPATAGFATALVGALWAYDGWTGVSRVGGEVKDPQRNVPRALVLGIVFVIGVYVLLTLVYLLVLGFDGMRGVGLDGDAARSIASRTAEVAFGSGGSVFVTVLILVSILGPLNGLTLAGPRVYYAMARDRLFPEPLARVHPVHRVPHVSIIFQAILSIVLAVFFTFEQLSSYVVLASWAAYGLTGLGLLRLRRLRPDLDRPFRVPGYPFVPITFLVLSTAFVLYLFVDAAIRDAGEAAVLGVPVTFVFLLGNVAVMALAWPIYRLFVARRTID